MGLEFVRLALYEQGAPVIVEERQWLESGLAEAWETIAPYRILSLSEASGYRVLTPGSFVGSLRLPSASLEVYPRYPKLFRDLAAFVSRHKPLPSTDTGQGEDARIVDVAAALVTSFETTAQHGLPFEYLSSLVSTSRPRGRILFSDTVRRHAAQGVHHVVTCLQQFKSTPDYFFRLMATCLSIIEADPIQNRSLLSRVQIARQLLPRDTPPSSLSEALECVELTLSEWGWREDIAGLASAARALLLKEARIWTDDIRLQQGVARFCDVNVLWEKAIHRAFAMAVADESWSVGMHPIRRSGLRVAEPGGPEIDPDVVIWRDGQPVAVVDAKNKPQKGWAADDVYQVLAYMRRMGAGFGVLVYIETPEGPGWRTPVARDQDGRAVQAMGIRHDGATEQLLEYARLALANAA